MFIKLSDFLKCGIYKITNNQNGYAYIGQSVNIYARFGQHARDLQIGKHNTKGLQEDFDKYGISAFALEILEECDPEELFEREQEHIKRALYNYEKLYNTLQTKRNGKLLYVYPTE